MTTIDEFDADHGLQRGRKRAVGAALLAAAIATLVAAGALVMRYQGVSAEDRVEVPWSDDEALLGDVDLARVFSELLPAAFVAPAGPAAALARDELLAAVASDDALYAAFDELLAARSAGDPAAALIREEQLVDEINAYLDAAAKPWTLRLPMDPRMRAGSLFALSYFVGHDVALSAAEQVVPVRIATRVDSLNVVEGILGHADETSRGAFLIIDRTAEAAADRIWPLLDPHYFDVPREGAAAALAPAIRGEAERLLPADAWDAATRAAPDRAALVDVRAAIDARAACGARVSLTGVPLRGFSHDDLASWRSLASPASGRGCPDITFEELRIMDEASARLRGLPGARAGARGLTAVVARSIAVHEAQHVRDFETPPSCETCPAWLGDAGVSELSAYLASWAWSDAPATELLLSCDLLAGRDSATRRAVAFGVEAIGYTRCEGAPPADINAAAAAARAELFGPSEPLSIPATFPALVRSAGF